MSVSRSAVASRTVNPCKSSFNFIENSLFFRKISGQYRLPVLYTGSFTVYMEKCADYPANPAQSAVADWLPNWTVTTLPAFSSVPGSGLSRGKNLAALKQNAHAVKCVVSAVLRCRCALRVPSA